MFLNKSDFNMENKRIKSWNMFNESSEYQSPNHIRDLLYDWIGDAKCEVVGSEKFMTFKFSDRKDHSEAVEVIEDWNIGCWTSYSDNYDNYFSNHYNIVVWDKELEDYLTDKFSDCERVKSKTHPETYVFWMKSGSFLAIQDVKRNELSINKLIWKHFVNYGISNSDLRAFLKNVFYKQFGLEEYSFYSQGEDSAKSLM